MATINTRMTLTDKVSGSLTKVAKAFDKTKRSTNGAEQAATRVERQMQKVKPGRGLSAINNLFKKIKKNADKASQSSSMVGQFFKGQMLVNAAMKSVDIIKNGVGAAFDAMFNQAKYKKAFQILKGSATEGAALYDKTMKAALQTSFNPADILGNTQSFMSLTGGNEALLDQANNLAQRLAAFDTSGQGLAGAGFSLKEAMTGDFVSIVDRFNLPRAYFNNSGIKDLANAGDVEGVMQMLDDLLNSYGMTTEGMAEMMNNPRDQFARFMNVAKAKTADAMQSIMASISPVIERMNNWLNSEAGTATIDAIATAVTVMVNIIVMAINGAIWVWDNFGGAIKVVGMVIAGVLAIIAVYQTTMLVLNAAVWLVEAAQWAWNAAMAVNPIGLIVVAIVAAVLALFYWSDAMGTVVGAALWLWEVVLNCFRWIHNAAIDVGQGLVNAWNISINAIANFFIWLWNKIIDIFIKPFMVAFAAVGEFFANTFIKGANLAIGGINMLIKALNKIPGVNIGTIGEFEEVTGWADAASDKADSWKGKPIEAPDMVDWSDKKLDYGDPGAKYDEGFNKGKDFAEKTKEQLGGLLDMVTGKDKDGKGKDPNIPVNVNVTGGTIDKIEEEVKIDDEIVKTLEDFARAQYQQNFINLQPSINIENLNNQTETDPDTMLKELASGINGSIARKASGSGVAW